MRQVSSWLLELIAIKTVILITIKKKLFFQANCFNFFSSQDSVFVKHIKLEKLKKKLDEELMRVAWHPNRWWDCCVSDDEKKQTDPMFIEEL